MAQRSPQSSPRLGLHPSMTHGPIRWLGLALLTFGAGAAWAGFYARSPLSSETVVATDPPPTQANPLIAATQPAAAQSASNSIPTAAARRLQEAQNALDAGQYREALARLEGLTDQIPSLADQILMMRGIAYERLLSPVSAQQTWESLLEKAPDSSLVPRALQGLGQIETLRRRFPAHPITGEARLEQLAQTSDLTLVAELVRYQPQIPGLVPWLDRWTQAQSGQITAEEWQQIGDAYWYAQEYGKASRAYDRAQISPQTLYRHGRSHQVSREAGAAREVFQALLAQYPDSEEAPLTRRRLAALSDALTAIDLLRPVAQGESEQAPAALVSLIRLYRDNASPQSAQTAREELWTRFPDSDAAAQDAWPIAWSQAESGDLQTAIQVAQRIGWQQQDSELGAQLAYWSGKWQQQLGQEQAADQTFARVLEQFPHTYYAWRAAVQQDLPVGDFSLGRWPVQVEFSPARLDLPQVSAAVQALYSLGMDTAAWQRWQWETPILTGEYTPEQAFVAGVLRNAAGDHLRGINQVTRLRFDPDPEVEPLRQRADFWQAIYPLHFHDSADNRVGGDPFSQRGLAEQAQRFNLNSLLMAALIRQESRFEAAIASRAGALGLMQVMPSTGQWIAGQVGLQGYELTEPADNLYLGAWYLDYTHRTYQDSSLLAVASYNGGPGNVAQWLDRFGFSDPDRFVEQIPFPETRGYVKAVFGNHWNYWQLYTPEGRALASQSLGSQPISVQN